MIQLTWSTVPLPFTRCSNDTR